MESLEIKFWNRRKGEKKITKTFDSYDSFLDFMEETKPNKGKIIVKINGGYGKNHKTGHTLDLNFCNNREEIIDLIFVMVNK